MKALRGEALCVILPVRWDQEGICLTACWKTACPPACPPAWLPACLPAWVHGGFNCLVNKSKTFNFCLLMKWSSIVREHYLPGSCCSCFDALMSSRRKKTNTKHIHSSTFCLHNLFLTLTFRKCFEDTFLPDRAPLQNPKHILSNEFPGSALKHQYDQWRPSKLIHFPSDSFYSLKTMKKVCAETGACI